MFLRPRDLAVKNISNFELFKAGLCFDDNKSSRCKIHLDDVLRMQKILADQLTLSQPRGADYAPHVSTRNLRLSVLAPSLQQCTQLQLTNFVSSWVHTEILNKPV